MLTVIPLVILISVSTLWRRVRGMASGSGSWPDLLLAFVLTLFFPIHALRILAGSLNLGLSRLHTHAPGCGVVRRAALSASAC